MYYAILDTRSDVTAATVLLWGDELKSVAAKIVAECKRVLDDECEDMTLDEIEEEYEDAYLDEYKALRRKRKISAESLQGFQFYIGDISIEVAVVCEGYSRLSLFFDKYVEGKMMLSEWRMAESIVEDEGNLSAMRDELLALADAGETSDMNYFIRRQP